MATFALTQQSFLQKIRLAGSSPLLIPGINLLLILWLAWLLSRLTWTALSGGEGIPLGNVSGESSRTVQSEVKSEYNAAQIASWHLLGKKVIVKKVTPVKKEKAAPTRAPETRLNLTLSGVFAADGDSARAIIGDPRGKDESYSVGDPVPGGARLYEIYADRVILERNGGYETLRLPQDGVGNRSSSSPRGRNTRNTRPQGSSTQRGQALQRYKSRIQQNPMSFTDYVRPTPVRENGRFIGFRLQEGREMGALDDLGLIAGDVVTSINGVQLDSPSKGMQAMRSLSGSGENVNLTVMRDGREVALNFSLPSH
ncbi:MAG: type II secretion system protein GspC [Gammaproteobacteria bacterium]